MNENDKIILKLCPKFNIIYELFRPTGKKIKSTLLLLILFTIITIFVNIVPIYRQIEIYKTINLVLYIILGFFGLKLTFHLVFQILQYKNISYSFYKDHMIYEDSFLNQSKKTIKYENIKEIEIRRTIFDRIIGYGIIIIHTNAENARSNGLIVYSVKNPKKYYDQINDIIYKKNNEENIDSSNEVDINKNNKVEDFSQNNIEIEESDIKTTDSDIQKFQDDIKN